MWTDVYPTKLGYNPDRRAQYLEKLLLSRAVMRCQKVRRKYGVLRPPSLQGGGKTRRRVYNQ